ncbi:hypothetical protein THAOC_18503, partial [Thalassiosira oceanica]
TDEPRQRDDGIRPGKRARQRINDHSGLLTPEDESERIKLLEAVRAIATGVPRPGHGVVGAGTYRDGMRGWVALAREYAALATVPGDGDRRGLEEVALYRAKDGEVASIEHLANTRDLLDDGGAMARIFFVLGPWTSPSSGSPPVIAALSERRTTAAWLGQASSFVRVSARRLDVALDPAVWVDHGPLRYRRPNAVHYRRPGRAADRLASSYAGRVRARCEVERSVATAHYLLLTHPAVHLRHH